MFVIYTIHQIRDLCNVFSEITLKLKQIFNITVCHRRDVYKRQVQSLISSGNISKLPKVGLYVALAVAYVILAGPGLYFFFKQRRLRRYYHCLLYTSSCV